jgi:hypothetical protein
MKTILVKKQNHSLDDGRFLKLPSGELAYFTDKEIESLRMEHRLAPNQAEVLAKGRTARHSSTYIQYGHNPAVWLKTMLQRWQVSIPEAARVLGVGTRTMQRWATLGSGSEISPHLMDVLAGWPNYRDQGGTVESYREWLRKEGHPAFRNKKK